MPSDITGSPIYDERIHDFRFRPGPVFSQLLLADEINRAPAKTHSALLEIMQETRVTIDGVRHVIERPFLVLATQNPIESEGTYNLPEAQLDRFRFKLVVD
jgi:MoxR-like ATPase